MSTAATTASTNGRDSAPVPAYDYIVIGEKTADLIRTTTRTPSTTPLKREPVARAES